MTQDEYIEIINEYYDLSEYEFHKLIAIRKFTIPHNVIGSKLMSYIYYINKKGELKYLPISDNVLLETDEQYVIFEDMDMDIIHNGTKYNVVYYMPNSTNYSSLLLYWYYNSDIKTLSANRFKNEDIKISYTRKNFEIIDEL